MAKLILITGVGQTKQINLPPHISLVGRAATNDIVIDMNRVSRVHARIVVDEDFVSIMDLDSRNGTTVNGVRVISKVLVNGDMIRIGDCDIRFLEGDKTYSDADALALMTAPTPLEGIGLSSRPQPTAKD